MGTNGGGKKDWLLGGSLGTASKYNVVVSSVSWFVTSFRKKSPLFDSKS